jgi:hypothetical protein
LIETSRGVDEVGLSKRELTNDVRWNICVAGFAEVAVRGPPDESSVAGRVEPAAHLAGRRELDRLLLMLLLMFSVAAASSTTTSTAASSTLSAAATAAMSPPATVSSIVESAAAAFLISIVAIIPVISIAVLRVVWPLRVAHLVATPTAGGVTAAAKSARAPTILEAAIGRRGRLAGRIRLRVVGDGSLTLGERRRRGWRGCRCRGRCG